MNDLTLSEILATQLELYEKHRDEWSPITPEYGKNFILYMIEEIGEAIAVIKKKGTDAIMDDPSVRASFIEELADVMMYFSAVMLRYGISAEEFSRIYLKKHAKNMGRDFEEEYRYKFEHSEFCAQTTDEG